VGFATSIICPSNHLKKNKIPIDWKKRPSGKHFALPWRHRVCSFFPGIDTASGLGLRMFWLFGNTLVFIVILKI